MGIALIPPSWQLNCRLLGTTFCDRKPHFSVLLCLTFVHPPQHIPLLLFPDQPVVVSGHKGTICLKGRGITPWCKLQPLIDRGFLRSVTQTVVCAPAARLCPSWGAPCWQQPLSFLPHARCSVVCYCLSGLSLYSLQRLATAWAPVQEMGKELQAPLAEDI